MANLNKVMLIGNLTRDPELRYLQSGTAVCDVGIAVNRQWKTPTGETKKDVCFVDVSFFGRLAEVVSEFCKKGSPLYVEGRLKLDSWTGKDGQKQSKMRVVGESMQFLSTRGAGAPQGSPAPARPQQQGQAPPPPETPKTPPDDEFQVDDDSIPF